MAPQRQGPAGGSHPAGFASGGKANGLYQSSSAAMAAAKKPNLQLIQADHELFLQAFESESLLSTSCTFVGVTFPSFIQTHGELCSWPREYRRRSWKRKKKLEEKVVGGQISPLLALNWVFWPIIRSFIINPTCCCVLTQLQQATGCLILGKPYLEI